MELTLSCFNCKHQIPPKANYYFCSKCFTQLKCKNCDEFLEKDALGCSNCGTPVVNLQPSENTAINTIEFEQKGNNKRFVASFTNAVGENLVASLGGLFLGTNSSYKVAQNPFSQTKDPFSQTKGGQFLPPSNAQPKDNGAGNFEEAIVVEPNNDELGALLIKIFEYEGEKISLVNSRLKQSGKRDHAIRITILLLYAYTLTGKKQIKRSDIVEVLQGAAVYDNNFIFWLSKCDEIKKLDGELLELNLPGKDAALEILKEFGNTSIEKGSVHFSALSGKASKGRSKKAKTDSVANSDSSATTKNSSSSSKMTPVKMIDILISENYFKQKRRIPEVIKYCKEIKAHTLDSSTLSVALGRMIKNGRMKREKNPSDNQYEYYQ